MLMAVFFVRPIMRQWAKNCSSKVVRVYKKLFTEERKLIFKSCPKLQKVVLGQLNQISKESSEVTKSRPRATKPNLKSRPKVLKIVQRSDKTKLQKSSEIAKNCPTKRQNQFLKVVRCRKKLSNKVTKPIFKSLPMS